MSIIKRVALPVLLAITSLLAKGQCDKNVKFITEKVNEVKTGNMEGDSLPVSGTIQLTKDSISVAMQWQNGETTIVRGSNSKLVCKMNKDFKEGTIDVTSDAEIKSRGQTSKATMFFTIIGKEGKFKIYAAPENDKDKICFTIREWQEIK